jgi:hypothetical protein
MRAAEGKVAILGKNGIYGAWGERPQSGLTSPISP